MKIELERAGVRALLMGEEMREAVEGAEEEVSAYLFREVTKMLQEEEERDERRKSGGRKGRKAYERRKKQWERLKTIKNPVTARRARLSSSRWFGRVYLRSAALRAHYKENTLIKVLERLRTDA